MSDTKNRHRYKHAEGKRWIEVRVRSPLQLFDARDPAPFRERELDDDFIEYITASAREFPISSPLKIVIYIEEDEKKDLSRESIREAIQSYLSYHSDLQRGDLKSHMKMAQAFLLIGLLILAACVAAAR